MQWTPRVVGIGVVVSLASGCLRYADFLDKKSDKFCDQYAICNPDADCTLPEETGASDTGCEYDAGAAKDCLNGTWSCNEDVPGFEYPLPPQACEQVCG